MDTSRSCRPWCTLLCLAVVVALQSWSSGRRARQMQPRGLGMPAILAASLAGPFGNSV